MNIAINPIRDGGADTSGLLDYLFRPMGVAGVYARTAIYERVVEGLQRAISNERPDRAEVFRFPPVMSRRQLEDAGYLKSFPQLLGCVCALHGTEREILDAAERSGTDDDWTGATSSTDLVEPGGVLSGLSHRRSAGTSAGRGLYFRRRGGLLLARAFARSRSSAVFPHA